MSMLLLLASSVATWKQADFTVMNLNPSPFTAKYMTKQIVKIFISSRETVCDFSTPYIPSLPSNYELGINFPLTKSYLYCIVQVHRYSKARLIPYAPSTMMRNQGTITFSLSVLHAVVQKEINQDSVDF